MLEKDNKMGSSEIEPFVEKAGPQIQHDPRRNNSNVVRHQSLASKSEKSEVSQSDNSMKQRP